MEFKHLWRNFDNRKRETEINIAVEFFVKFQTHWERDLSKGEKK